MSSLADVFFTSVLKVETHAVQMFLQMNAEFVFPSPFIPPRQEKILRFCKQHSEDMWAVVDVSVDTIRESSFSSSSVKWNRLPSGCLVQDVGSGYSLVISYQAVSLKLYYTSIAICLYLDS